MSPWPATAQRGHPLGAQPHLLARLGARRNLDPGAAAVDRRHLDLATQGGGGHRDRHAAEQVHPVALEDRVLLHLDEDVEIALRPAAQAGFALAGKPDPRAGFHPGGNVHRKLAFLFHPALAVAGAAGVLDGLAHAVAVRAGAFDREEALLRPDLAHAEQVGQVTGSAPPSAPVPRQVSQVTEAGTLMVFWTPW
jgi:hypothetical protein